MELDKKIKIFKISQYFVTSMAGVFFAGQLINMFKPSLYLKIDPYLGFFPSLFNNIMPMAKIDMGYRQVPAGYLIAAGVCIAIYHLLSKKIIPALEDSRFEEEEKQQAKTYVEQVQIDRKAERAILKQVQYKNTFYALFDLQLSYNDDFKKNEKELEKLRFEYYKIFVGKLKKKYKEIEFIVKDKIFFISNNCDLLQSITVDILKILDIVVKISKYNSIRVNLLFSFWLDDSNAGKMNVFRTLTQINALGNKNKIVLTKEIHAKILSSGQKPWCSVNTLGVFRLFNAYNGMDIDVDLVEITSIEKQNNMYY